MLTYFMTLFIGFDSRSERNVESSAGVCTIRDELQIEVEGRRPEFNLIHVTTESARGLKKKYENRIGGGKFTMLC